MPQSGNKSSTTPSKRIRTAGKGNGPVQNSLRASIKDGVFFSMMTGFGESYLGAYAIFLGASNPQIGLLSSLPQLLGAFFQFVSVRVTHLLQQRRRVILAGVVLQALTWIPIILFPLIFSSHRVDILIGLVVLYFLGVSFATPPWTSLIGDLVHPRRRGWFFAKRNRLISITSFTALCLGGLILHQAQGWGIEGIGFVVIFSLAFAARWVSAYYLTRHVDPTYASKSEDQFSIWEFLIRGRRSNFGRFVLYVALMYFSVQVSAPFVTPYLLRDLQFSYVQFMAVAAAAVIAQFLTMNFWGRLADYFGNKRVLQLTGLLLPVIPPLWLLTVNFYAILGIQMFAGFAWAGFSLAMGNYVLDVVTPPKRARCVALYNSANAIGIFIGASLGGTLSRWLPREVQFAGMHFSLASNLLFLFLISAIFRLSVSLAFLPTFREVREVHPFVAREFFVRIAYMRPLAGLKFDLFIPSRRGRAGPSASSGEDAAPSNGSLPSCTVGKGDKAEIKKGQE
ncbi:MAG TPA: MFS transporter [Nitrospiria bacterium]|nr:MFS transporter [Nitrospiria bacterium]